MNEHKKSYYIINGITMYRLVSAPFLILLAATDLLNWFKWLMMFSFFTDAIDGPLSRKYKVTSIFGARLDSVADDATVLASAISLWIVFPSFIREHWLLLTTILVLLAIQTIAALVAYKKVTSFHTYFAKSAALAQGFFFILLFFDIGPVLVMFYLAVFLTAIELAEEIVLVILLPEWKSNVNGLYWVLRERRNQRHELPRSGRSANSF